MKILFNIAIITQDKVKQWLSNASRQALSFPRLILQKGPFFVIQKIVSMEWGRAQLPTSYTCKIYSLVWDLPNSLLSFCPEALVV